MQRREVSPSTNIISMSSMRLLWLAHLKFLSLNISTLCLISVAFWYFWTKGCSQGWMYGGCLGILGESRKKRRGTLELLRFGKVNLTCFLDMSISYWGGSGSVFLSLDSSLLVTNNTGSMWKSIRFSVILLLRYIICFANKLWAMHNVLNVVY